MKPRRTLVSVSAIALSLVAARAAHATFTTFSVGGDATPASIQPTVTNFQTAIGNPNNGNNPGTTGGRREINWDGGNPAITATAVGGTPFTVFLNNRGALITGGTGFVQAPPSGLATQFGNASYGAGFGNFSPSRDFAEIGSNVQDITFFTPGSNGGQPAVVSGFGAVFTDVDLANTTRLEFFNLAGVEVFNQTVAPGTVANGSLSFLGAVSTTGDQIARVRITTGTGALGPGLTDGAGVDAVALDDFIFAEPAAVPEPVTALLAGVGLLSIAGAALRRRTVR